MSSASPPTSRRHEYFFILFIFTAQFFIFGWIRKIKNSTWNESKAMPTADRFLGHFLSTIIEIIIEDNKMQISFIRLYEKMTSTTVLKKIQKRKWNLIYIPMDEGVGSGVWWDSRRLILIWWAAEGKIPKHKIYFFLFCAVTASINRILSWSNLLMIKNSEHETCLCHRNSVRKSQVQI